MRARNIMVKKMKKDACDIREKTGVKTGLAGLCLNIMLGAGKLTVGILSGSVAIISDAANNLSDAGNSLVTVSSFLLGGRKADKQHPYGHGRYEYIASLLIGMIIVIVGFQFAISSVQKIISPVKVTISGLMLGVMIASIAVKMFMTVFYRIYAKKINSSTLKAASADSFFDCLVTACVIIGILLTIVLPLWVDGVVALIVSGVIVFGGVKILLETINRLLGYSDKETADKIRLIIKENPQIIGSHDLRLHDYGPNNTLASVHAEFDRTTNIMEAHNVIDSLEHRAFDELGVELVVHCDPIDSTDLTLNRIRHNIKDVIRIYDKSSIHDLEINYNEKNVFFHMRLRERQYTKQRVIITSNLQQSVQEVLPDFEVKIEFDIIYD